MQSTLLTVILQESILLFLIIGSIFALLLGLLFVLAPQQADALSLRYNRWLSLRRPSKFLEVTHETDHYFYRQHRVIGLFILFSASYILYRFAFDYDQTASVHTLTSYLGNANVVAWLLEASLWFLLPISLLLTLFGAVLAIKPSLLKGLERQANRWISTRNIIQPIDKQNKTLDNLAHKNPHYLGWFLIFAASYNLSILLMFFINHLQ